MSLRRWQELRLVLDRELYESQFLAPKSRIEKLRLLAKELCRAFDDEPSREIAYAIGEVFASGGYRSFELLEDALRWLLRAEDLGYDAASINYTIAWLWFFDERYELSKRRLDKAKAVGSLEQEKVGWSISIGTQELACCLRIWDSHFIDKKGAMTEFFLCYGGQEEPGDLPLPDRLEFTVDSFCSNHSGELGDSLKEHFRFLPTEYGIDIFY